MRIGAVEAFAEEAEPALDETAETDCASETRDAEFAIDALDAFIVAVIGIFFRDMRIDAAITASDARSASGTARAKTDFTARGERVDARLRAALQPRRTRAPLHPASAARANR